MKKNQIQLRLIKLNTIKSINYLLFISIALLLSLLSNVVKAQDEILSQKPIVVEGESTSIENQAKQTIVITNKDIENTKAKTLVEVLKTIPGVTVNSYGSYHNASIYMKGGSTHSTIVLINGVRVETPTASSFDFGQIPLNAVERIEIIQGSSAVSYASNASSGVINIITKKANYKENDDNKPTFELPLTLEGGTSNFSYLDIGYLLATKNSNFAVFYGNNASDGYSFAYPSDSSSEKDGYNAYNILTSYSYKNLEALLQVNYSDISVDPIGISGGLLDANQTFYDDYRVEKTTYNFYIRLVNINLFNISHNFTTSASTSNSVEDKLNKAVYPLLLGGNTSIAYENEVAIETLDGAAMNANYNGIYNYNDKGFVKFGADYNVSNVQKEVDAYSIRSSQRKETTSPLASQDTYSLNLSTGYRLLDAWEVNGGVRYNDYGDINISEALNPSLNGNYDANVKSNEKVNYNLGTSYLFADNYKFRINYANSYKVQSLFEFYKSTNLLTEHNKGFDVGLDGLVLDKYSFSVGYFNQYVKNLIWYNPFSDSFYNDTKNINTQGFVLYNKNNVNEYVNFSLGYTYLLADEILIRRPKHSFTSNVELKPIKKLSLFVEYFYIGESTDGIPNAFYVDFNAYHLVNTKVQYDFTNKISTYIKATNVLNTDYQNAYGFATEGLGVYVGLVWK